MAIATAPGAIEEALSPGEKRHLQALEGRIERGLQTFREVGLALLEIRDKRLYRLGFPSFEAYCRERWGMERQRAYQLMGAAEVVQVLPEGKGPANETQARELVPLMQDPPLLKRVWEEVASRDAPITAQAIREVVRDFTADEGGNGRRHATPVTPTAKLVAVLTKVRADVEVWKATKPHRSEVKQVTTALDEVVKALG